MAEARGLLIESVASGHNSKGFQLYARLAGSGLGEMGDAYRCYLFSVFDELALDLKVLFDRYSPQGRLFPREPALLEALQLINAPDIAPLWAEDETIGWIYQYFNSKEERKKMRDESAAPRNSRELAVRNQFFTPRYVVEFLTDNTLGRIWYEMAQGRTALKERCGYLVRRPREVFLAPGEVAPEPPSDQGNLSQEELLQQPVYIPFRALKDPREIKMLDPACGSMHFGLYAFDLFECIYEEAWDLNVLPSPTGGDARGEGLKPLRETYADKGELLRDVPRLIIERNIHGIDIDPRAVQIAGLSLWLRAQRTWQQQGLKPGERFRIRRSNIVCAEPMPGEEAFLEEFVTAHLSATPERKLLGQLVRRVFEAMKLAGEAGSLLKIEEEIAGAVAEAKQKWLVGPKREQGRLFADDTAPPVQQQLGLDVTGITDETFWEKAEERIYAALQTYAGRAEHGDGYQRRLFADDAARGFAFIDLCRKRYDVVLMNPPFGEATRAIYQQEIPAPAGSSREIASLFLTRSIQQLSVGGRIGVLATRLLMFLDQLDEWREAILSSCNFALVADLGYGVLDAVVEPAAFVISREGRLGTFFRLLSASDKATALAAAIVQSTPKRDVFAVPNCWGQIPSHRIAYWAPKHWIDLFAERPVEAFAKVSKGLETGEDDRFLRLHVEVPPNELDGRWRRYAKGGDYQPTAGNYELVVDFKLLPVARRTTDSEIYGVPGITYTQRTTSFLSFRALPAGSVFSPGGPGIIPLAGQHLVPLLSYLNSRPVGALVEFCVGSGDSAVRGSAARNYTTGIMKRLPCLLDRLNSAQSEHIKQSIDRRFRCVQTHQLAVDELSPTFQGLRFGATRQSLKDFAISNAKSFLADALEVLRSDWMVDKIWRHIFGFSEADDGLLEADFARHPYHCGGGQIPEGFWGSPNLPTLDGDEKEAPVEGVSRQLMKRSHVIHAEFESLALRFNCDLEKLASESRFHRSLAASGRPAFEFAPSYALGTAFGRWDIRFATGEKPAPELPDPFAPLPVCPPGQLQNEQGLPVTKEDVARLKQEGRWNYPIEIPWDGILVDDPGHPLDIEARVHQVLQIIWKDRWEAIEREACDILGVRTLRDYFRKPASFFADHLKRYSKSRRQAPIYWPLSTASGRYTLWIYYHRLTDQTLYACVVHFVEPKLRQVSEAVGRLQAKGSARTRADEKELEGLQDFEIELQAFRDELLAWAPRWKPNLNDGVQITAAPLWKLFRLPKWQKTLKETWEKLDRGDYDWAHLAYTLWPDRVREKCKTDKSLAIAHDLEDLYQAPPQSAKKKRGRKPVAEDGGDD